MLGEIGRFRIVSLKDLQQSICSPYIVLAERSRYLKQRGPVSHDLVKARRDGTPAPLERIEVVTLTAGRREAGTREQLLLVRSEALPRAGQAKGGRARLADALYFALAYVVVDIVGVEKLLFLELVLGLEEPCLGMLDLRHRGQDVTAGRGADELDQSLLVGRPGLVDRLQQGMDPCLFALFRDSALMEDLF